MKYFCIHITYLFLFAICGTTIFAQTHNPYSNEQPLRAGASLYPDVKKTTTPKFTDFEYKRKMQELYSEIPLAYNTAVRRYIEAYTRRKRNLSERVLGLAEIYFPIFDEILPKYGIPTELKYLAIPESALNPKARSPVGATGLWQLMKGTAKEVHLTINKYIDERRDPYRSTEGAARYLKKLYDRYGDWLLVVAAYNCGPGKVNTAIRKSGSRDFWKLNKYLPRETRGHVPAFLACVYWVNYHMDHFLVPQSATYSTAYDNATTVVVDKPISLDAIVAYTGTSKKKLQFLNPSLTTNMVPAWYYPVRVRIPSHTVVDFEEHRSEIYAYGVHPKTKPTTAELAANYKRMKRAERENSATTGKIITNYVTTKVGSRTYYSLPNSTNSIAKIDGDASEEIKDKNLEAIASVADAVTKEKEPEPTEPNLGVEETAYYVHKVKSGENLDRISKNYQCTIDDLIGWNELKDNKLKIGQQLKIMANASTIATTSPTKTTVPSLTDVPATMAANDQADVQTTQNVNPSVINPAHLMHKVKSGESLARIAQNYKCTVKELKRWNGLRGNELKIGQELKIRNQDQNNTNTLAVTQPAANKPTPATFDASQLEEESGDYVYYTDQSIPSIDLLEKTPEPDELLKPTFQQPKVNQNKNDLSDEPFYVCVVQKTDNIKRIAERYGCTITDLVNWNELKNNHVYAGQKLKIKAEATNIAATKTNTTIADNTEQNSVSATVSDEAFYIYTIQAGDNVANLAKKFNCSQQDIRDWNDLSGNALVYGSRIKLFKKNTDWEKPYEADKEEVIAKESNDLVAPTIAEASHVIHKVRRGESLDVIAKKYKCDVKDLKKWNKLKSTRIDIGQELMVYNNGFVAPEEKVAGVTIATEATENQQPASDNYYGLSPELAELIGIPLTLDNGMLPADESTKTTSENGLTNANSTLNTPPSSPISTNETIASKDAITPNNTPVQATESIMSAPYTQTWYTVRRGDNLGHIAKKFDCDVKDLKAWNKLTSNRIGIGQHLRILGKPQVAQPPAPSQPEEKVVENTTIVTTPPNQPIILNSQPVANPEVNVEANKRAMENNRINEKSLSKRVFIYTVKSGDNLGYIADWYNCSVRDLKKWNNIKGKGWRLYIGQKLKVMAPDLPKYGQLDQLSFAEKQQMIGKINTVSPKVFDIIDYKVKWGDSLWTIAKQFPDSTIEDLMQLNQINQQTKLQPGAVIKVKVAKQ